MRAASETSDALLVDLLRQAGSLDVAQLARETGVTATAVRQRLNRLMEQGLVQRQAERAGRGRPRHRYSLTPKGVRSAGHNYADLAMVLWEQVRAVADPQVRRGLLQRIAAALADRYTPGLDADSPEERMQALVTLLGERDVPFEVDDSGELPVLTAKACPYPDIAQEDRSVCAMEKMLFSSVVGTDLRLTACRLDGDSCCTFEAS